jgi:hypothetical protein
MNYIKNLISIFALTTCFTSCKNESAENINILNSDSVRAQIGKILLIHENAVTENNAKGRKLIQELCMDSLLYEGTDGIITKVSSEYFSNDQFSGYKEKPHNKIIEIYGNSALASFVTKGYYLLTRDTVFYDVRCTRLFVRSRYQWKLAYSGITQLAVNYTEAAQNNPVLYPDFTGIYQADSAFSDTVSIINNELYIIRTGEHVKDKLIPVNDSCFFSKDVLGVTNFNRAAGKVYSYTFILVDGQRITARKVK